MNNLGTKIFIGLIAVLSAAAVLGVAAEVKAQAVDLEIVFEQDPLFSETNFLPGDSVSRWVRVKNNSGQTAYNLGVKADNIIDTDNLAGQFNFKIEDANTIYFQDSLNKFFSSDVVALGTIAPGEEKYYYFQAVFLPASGNEFQETSAGFDIVIGITGPGKPGGGDGGNSGGGTSSGGGRLLCFLTGTCGQANTSSPEPPENVIVAGEEGEPVLVMQKIVNPNFINPGDKASYKVVITNKGNLSAFNVILTDNLPTGLVFSGSKVNSKTWLLGDLAANESKTIVYFVTALADIKPGIYTNIAQAQADNYPKIQAKANLEVRPVAVKGISMEAVDLAPSGFSWQEFIFLLITLIVVVSAIKILKRPIKDKSC